MVALTGLLSSPERGAWLVVMGMGVALMGEEVRVEAARGKAVAGPGKRQTSKTFVFFNKAHNEGKMSKYLLENEVYSNSSFASMQMDN